MLSLWITEHLQWVFVAILLLNLAQRRRYDTAARKRLATLYIAAGLILLYAVAHIVRLLELPDPYLVPAAAAIGFALSRGRSAIGAFRLRCRSCNSRLTITEFLFHDSNLCANCRFGEPAQDASCQNEQ